MATVKDKKSTSAIAGVAKAAPRTNQKALYDYDRVLKAYEDGKKYGFELRDEIYAKTFRDNLTSAFDASKKIEAVLKAQKIACYKIFIKSTGIKKFTLFFIVSEDKYCSVEFAEIYSLSADSVEGFNSEVFELDFSFLPNSKSLNEKKLKADNFLMIYNGKNAKTRRT